MRYVKVKITRDTHTTYNREMPPWEVAVLEEIFDAGNIEVLDGSVQVDRPYPEVHAEFDRLARAYGADTQSGTPYVVAAYGTGGAGPRALAKAIADAKAEDEATPKANPKPVKVGRKSAAVVDSLLG